jgi:anti-sigma regulatory factor (Ser/Thr protein kinase)
MPAISWQQTFPGEECQLAVMRRWLASLLPGCPARDDLAVVATELGANAIQHTASGRGGLFAVQVVLRRDRVRIMVTDAGGRTFPRIVEDPVSEKGRGLRLVDGLSAGMGVSGDCRGRRVWADIAWGDAVTAGTASPRWGGRAVQFGGPAAGGLVAGGLVTGGLVTDELVAGGLVADELVTGGLATGGLVTGDPAVGGAAEAPARSGRGAHRRVRAQGRLRIGRVQGKVRVGRAEGKLRFRRAKGTLGVPERTLIAAEARHRC